MLTMKMKLSYTSIYNPSNEGDFAQLIFNLLNVSKNRPNNEIPTALD